MISHAIACWAAIEHDQSQILAHIMGAYSPPAIAMFRIIRKPQIRSEVLRAGAEETLSGRDLEMFNVVNRIVEKAQDTRNVLVHYPCGYSEQYPDDVIFQDPDKHSRLLADVIYKQQKATLEERGHLTDVDWSHYWLYAISDLQDIAARFRDIKSITHLLGMMLAVQKHPWQDSLYQTLISQPLVAKELRP